MWRMWLLFDPRRTLVALFTFLFVHFTKPGATPYFPGAAYVGASVISLVCVGLWWKRRSAELRSASAPSP